MRKSLLYLAMLLLIQSAIVFAEPIIEPFEMKSAGTTTSRIDRLVYNSLKKHSIESAYACSDEVFVRRVYIDVIGTVPSPVEVRSFLGNKKRHKRKLLIDTLLERNEFADYWSLKWCDVLRVKSEFPINLWPNAVQSYHKWIHESISNNMPYDQFARELITSSGSNFRVPPVNFYRAIQGNNVSEIASAVALSMMGTRLEHWPTEQRSDMESIFDHVAFKRTAEWKEEIVYNDPARLEPITVTFPDGTTTVIAVGIDPRVVFADWLIDPDNKWFARAVVNRIWAWLMGRGIIHEPDDIRSDSEAAIPELLKYLEAELIKSRYDLKHIYRIILNSKTYQQSAIPRSEHPKAESLFAFYIVRPLDAEVLIDALCQICGPEENYQSEIPEPFTFIPEEHRTITLSDGSITSAFLEMFGRPARDTGLLAERNSQPTNAQRLHMLNSTHIQYKIERGINMRALLQTTRGDSKQIVTLLYLSILSRPPLQSEIQIADSYFNNDEMNTRQATNDLAWVLVNSKEFLYQH